MVVIGKIHLVREEQKFTETFSKKEVIVETVEQYPQYYPIDFANNNINMLDGYQAGDLVEVNVNVRGNLSKAEGQEDRAFVSLVGWKITKR